MGRRGVQGWRRVPGWGRPWAGAKRAVAGGRCASGAARRAASLPPAVECAVATGPGPRRVSSAGGPLSGCPGSAGPRGRRLPGRRSCSSGAGEAPARRVCVRECACVRGASRPRGGGACCGKACGGSRARRARAHGQTAPRPLTHARAAPPGRPAPPRQRRGGGQAGAAVSARTRSLTDTHRHTHGPRHRHTTRIEPRPGSPSPPGAAHTRTRAHIHTRTRAEARSRRCPEAAVARISAGAGGK